MMREDKKHIYRLAYYDELTGMKNLHWFEENSPKIIRNNKEKNYAVLSFNLNRFDIIRSCYGEEAADEILKYSASVFYQETISKNGYPARANSDYFLSLVPYENPELLDKALRMICKRYEDYSIKGDMLKLKMVFGVCLLPKDGSMNIKKAINAATVAMREADPNFHRLFSSTNKYWLKSIFMNQFAIIRNRLSVIKSSKFIISQSST